MKYIKLTQGFCESNAHKRNGIDDFGYGVTINGDHFCDINSLNTHPELFDKNNLEYIEVTQDDIYQPTEEEIDGAGPLRMAIKTPEPEPEPEPETEPETEPEPEIEVEEEPEIIPPIKRDKWWVRWWIKILEFLGLDGK